MNQRILLLVTIASATFLNLSTSLLTLAFGSTVGTQELHPTAVALVVVATPMLPLALLTDNQRSDQENRP